MKKIYFFLTLALCCLAAGAQTTDELKAKAVTSIYENYTYTFYSQAANDFMKFTGADGEKTGGYASSVDDASRFKFIATESGNWYIQEVASGLYLTVPAELDGNKYLALTSNPDAYSEFKFRIDTQRVANGQKMCSFFPASYDPANPECLNHGGEGLCLYTAALNGNPRSWWYINAWDADGNLSDGFGFLTSLDDLSNDAAYIFTCPRGNFFSRQGENTLFGNFSLEFNAETDNKEFAVIKSQGGNYYLYSLGAKKFVGKDENSVAAITGNSPWQTVTIGESGNADYPWTVTIANCLLNLTSWQSVNDLKFVACSVDEGNSFNMMISSTGLDLTAAIEAVDKFEGYIKDPVSVTYNYLVDGKVVYTESTLVAPGDSIPAITLPYGVAFAEGVEAPAGVTEENVSFDLNVVFGDYPFTFSASVDNATWYGWKMRNSGQDGGYAHYDGSGFPETHELGRSADYYWAFIGTPFGFQVVNYYDVTKRLAGRGTKGKGNKPLYLGTEEEATLFCMAPSEAENVWGECYMYVAGSPDECINDVSNGLGYWYTSAAHEDTGSQITFEELSLDDLVTTVKLTVDITDAPGDACVVIDGKKYSHNDVAECDPLITAADILPTHFPGYHATVTIDGDYIFVIYSQYPFEVTTDISNPIVYTLFSGRGGNTVWTYDEGYIFIKALNNSTEQYWFFMDYFDEATGQYYLNLLPAADPTVVMGYKETTNGHTKVFAGHNGDENFDSRWVYATDGEGYYGFKPAANQNTYLSNYGGVTNRMGFYHDGPQRDGGTCITEFAPFTTNEVWLEVENNFGELYGQYRECEETWAAIEELQSTSFTDPTYTEWMAAVAAFYEAVKPYYIWFEEGKMYSFTNVQMDGTTYPFYMTIDGLRVGDANTPAYDYGDAATFLCHKSQAEEDKYFFTDCENGLYLIWKGNNGWNSNKGCAEEYVSEFCDLMLGFYPDEDRYFYIQGVRVDNCAGTFILNHDGTFNAWATGFEKAWTENYTTTFKIEEVDGPMNVGQMTVTPANSAIYDLSGRKITAPVKGLYIQSGKKYLAK